jgi:hypothetical protein
MPAQFIEKPLELTLRYPMPRADLIDPSYQTVPLAEYSPRFRTLASTLFDMVRHRTGAGNAIKYDGSFSLLAKSNSQTIAKIIVFEEGRGKVNGKWPHHFPDGVYVLVRASGTVATRVWNIHRDQLRTLPGLDRSETIGIAPNHGTRFAYVRFTNQHDLGRLADLLAGLSHLGK